MASQNHFTEPHEASASVHEVPDRSESDEGTLDAGPIAPTTTEEKGSIRDRLNIVTSSTGRRRSTSFGDTIRSPTRHREQAHRLDDDLRLLQIERQVSQQRSESIKRNASIAPGSARQRTRREEVEDDFDAATNPLHETTKAFWVVEHPTSNFAKFMKKIHNSSSTVRYFTYITPVALILLVPLLIGALLPNAKGARGANVGGVELMWFSIWLEIVWLTLWAGRILAKLLPWPIGIVSSLFTNNSKKWRDMAKQLEVAATLFFWWLGIEISFLPTMKNHQVAPHGTGAQQWMIITNKVWIAILVAVSCNFIEKIVIQLVAISFHQRTYQDRIELNKFQIASLAKLYQFSKVKIEMEDSEFETPSGDQPGSGARTPGQLLERAQKNTTKAFKHIGDVAGKIAGDFTGKQVKDSGHPHQVVLSLLATTNGGQVLARRLYRTFAREETETIHQEDLNEAFESMEEADAAFSMFDKDLNGDISMEELESVCVEIGRERKSITASLKDLDSVISSLDTVLMFVVLVIFILVLVSLISTSASGVLTSLGSLILGLSWLFSATAQEFLQSIVFVFVKHPFDVGDRVTVYGNTGVSLQGDDYFVKEISLLYTEFKKMEGHIVQAPNSYLNTLFILNHRRSGGLAEAIPITFKFGTTLEQIEGLRDKLLEFVRSEKREYQNNILTELRNVVDAHSISLNIVFFFKSNWQNELLRLQRRNKFFCALMIAMQELGIEGPQMRYPGQKESFPIYMQQLPWSAERAGRGGTPDNPDGLPIEETFVRNEQSDASQWSSSSNRFNKERSRSNRTRGESIAQMGKRYDFSLGMTSMASADNIGDVHSERGKFHVPIAVQAASQERLRRSTSGTQKRSGSLARFRSTSRTTGFVPPSSQQVHNNTVERTSTSIHRNRFFGRKSQETDRMESGMAGIPERRSEVFTADHIDPRSGTVSPAAVRADTDADRQPFPSIDEKFAESTSDVRQL